MSREKKPWWETRKEKNEWKIISGENTKEIDNSLESKKNRRERNLSKGEGDALDHGEIRLNAEAENLNDASSDRSY